MKNVKTLKEVFIGPFRNPVLPKVRAFLLPLIGSAITGISSEDLKLLIFWENERARKIERNISVISNQSEDLSSVYPRIS